MNNSSHLGIFNLSTANPQDRCKAPATRRSPFTATCMGTSNIQLKPYVSDSDLLAPPNLQGPMLIDDQRLLAPQLQKTPIPRILRHHARTAAWTARHQALFQQMLSA